MHNRFMNAAEALSEDHKPNLESERRRIEGEGGVVIWAGTWRVGGVLAVSRAFGDRPLKRYVVALPEVKHQAVAAGDETIVLASDGLWDVLENQVRNLLRVNGPAVHVDRYRQAGTLKYSRLGTKCHPKSLKSTTAAVT